MILSISLSIVFLFLDLNVNANTERCNGADQYSSCSSNPNCGCLKYAFPNTIGVCSLLTQSCSEFVPCVAPNYACSQSGHRCLYHPRCNSNPVCFPSTMFGESLCPLNIISNYSSALDATDGRYTRPGSLSGGLFRYEAMQITVDTTGTYNLSSISTLNTIGCLYNDTFYPSAPSVNLIQQDNDNGGNNQFKLMAFLEAGVPYTLVLTTQSTGYTGTFSIVASGPGNAQFVTINATSITPPTTTMTMPSMTTEPTIFTTDYLSVLTSTSGNYTRYGGVGLFYYQAIEVGVTTTGTYTFKTSSNISDTYGYLYQGNFYPTYPMYNIITSDDDSSGDGQFRLRPSLRSDLKYILVFTTCDEYVTGSFNIFATGPGDIFFSPYM